MGFYLRKTIRAMLVEELDRVVTELERVAK